MARFHLQKMFDMVLHRGNKKTDLKKNVMEADVAAFSKAHIFYFACIHLIQ